MCSVPVFLQCIYCTPSSIEQSTNGATHDESRNEGLALLRTSVRSEALVRLRLIHSEALSKGIGC
jgi:hypothetical protein